VLAWRRTAHDIALRFRRRQAYVVGEGLNVEERAKNRMPRASFRTANPTIEEKDAMFAVRTERMRLAKEGTQVNEQGAKLAAAPAEIGPGNCQEWDSVIIEQRQQGLCCLQGPDVGYVPSMCMITSFRNVWPWGRSGWYADDTESCFGNWIANEPKSTGCDATWIGQDY
jgi:hypothetical protein